jgi:hypothetical protein
MLLPAQIWPFLDGLFHFLDILANKGGIAVFFWIFAALASLALLSLFTSVSLEYRLHYRHGMVEHWLFIRFLLFGRRIDLLNRDRFFKKKSKARAFQKNRPPLDVGKFLYRLLQRMRIDRSSLQLKLGWDDAFAVAMAVGTLQSLLYAAIAAAPFRQRSVLLKGVSIKPQFNRKCLECSVHCIVKITLADIISAANYALIKKQRNKRSE